MPRHLPAIGALRGIAALYVVLFHVMRVPKPRPGVSSWLLPFINTGYSGVPLFFIISAFTLCHTMQGRSENHATLRFYARRVIRIMPLFYTVLAVTLVWSFLRGAEVSLWKLLLNMVVPGGQQGIVMASWSISVEMLFYALFPWLLKWINGTRRAVLFLALSIGISALFSRLVDGLPLAKATQDYFYRFSLLRSLPCFATGMLVYWAYRGHDSMEAGRSRRFGSWLLAVGTVGAVVVAALDLKNSRPAFVIHSVFYGLVALGLLLTNIRLVVNRVTEFFGEVSYSLYLWHPLVIVWLNGVYPRLYAHVPVTAAWFACLGLTLAAVVPLAFLSFKLVEEPTRRAGLRALKRWAGSEAPATQFAI